MNINKLNLFFIVFLFFSFDILAKENVKIVYQYKKEEVIDFSELSVSGNVIAPADLTIKGRQQEEYGYDFPIRKSFDDLILEDLHDIK